MRERRTSPNTVKALILRVEAPDVPAEAGTLKGQLGSEDGSESKGEFVGSKLSVLYYPW